MAGISRQAYHKYFQKQDLKHQQHEMIIDQVIEKREKHKRMGARPMYFLLNVKQMGINQFEKLLSERGFSIARKCRRINTTQGKKDKEDVNLVKGLAITDINQVIVGDITYFFAPQKLFYIFSLKDAYSKRIVGIYGSESLSAKGAIKCLRQAIRLRGKENMKCCIHHTDAGSQYKSKSYRNVCPELKWSIAANCLENGMAEQLNHIIKNGYLNGEPIRTEEQLNKRLKEVMRLINEERPVAQLNYKNPLAFEQSLATIKKESHLVFRFSSFEDTPQMGTFKKA